MTCLASLRLQYLVNHFLFKIIFLVALVADVVSLAFQEMDPRRCMGIMTGDASSRFQRRMHKSLVGADLFSRMTGIAYFVAFLFHVELGDNTVPLMALFAL